MINIGKYIEIAINWLTEHFARFFDVINDGVGGFIDAFQDGLTWIPFYVMILGLALLAWFKAGKGVGVFTALGLLLIYGMGFWFRSGTRRFRNGDFRHAPGCAVDRSGNPSSPGRYCGGYPLIWRYFLSVAL